jgi:hypothetical protein
LASVSKFSVYAVPKDEILSKSADTGIAATEAATANKT